MTLRISGTTAIKAAACVLSLHACVPAHGQASPASPAAPAASAPASASGEGTQGRKTCRPTYPEAAKRARAEGTTVVQLTVAADGAATKVVVARSAGPTPEHKMLDQAAVEALRACPFKPAADATGKPVEATVKVDYVWLLDPPGAAASGVRR